MKWVWICAAGLALGVLLGGCVVNKVRDWTAPPETPLAWKPAQDVAPDSYQWKFGTDAPASSAGGLSGAPGGGAGLGGLGGFGGLAGGAAGNPPASVGGAAAPLPAPVPLQPTATDEFGGWLVPLLVLALIAGVMAIWENRKKIAGCLGRLREGLPGPKE